MKKNLLSILLITTMVLALCGCSKGQGTKVAPVSEETLADYDHNTLSSDSNGVSISSDSADGSASNATDDTSNGASKDASADASANENADADTTSPEAREALYNDFLLKNSKANCASTELTLEELFQYSKDELNNDIYGDGEDHFTQLEKGYAYFDAGLDGQEELVVYQKLQQEAIDEYLIYYFFNIKDGKVTYIGSERNNSRGYTSFTEAGIVVSGGSNGASSYSQSKYFFDAEGNRVFDYYQSTELSLGRAVIPYSYIPDIIVPADYPSALWDGSSETLGCDAYTYEEFDYYGDFTDDDYMAYLSSFFFSLYDDHGKSIEPEDTLKGFYDEHGICYYSVEDTKEMLKSHEQELGLTEEANAAMQVVYSQF